jgi:hypothetical protein
MYVFEPGIFGFVVWISDHKTRRPSDMKVAYNIIQIRENFMYVSIRSRVSVSRYFCKFHFSIAVKIMVRVKN